MQDITDIQRYDFYSILFSYHRFEWACDLYDVW